MLGRWLLDFWRGYVVVTLRGPQVPELVNLATGAGIELWEIRQVKGGAYRMNMHRDDVRRLIKLLRQTRTKIRFERKFGVPFLAWRAWRRKFFLAGALTFLIALNVTTSVVWNVEVIGDLKRVSPETIEEAASQIGIHRGAWIGKLPDADILQNQLLDKVPELAWAGVQTQGTKISIQVVEKIEGTKPAPTEPQNIVATKQGTIREIYPHKGVKAVKRGDFVQPGQVLISGTLGDGKTSVHATGEVRAAVWYKSTVSVPLLAEHKSYTGNAVEKQFLTFWGFPVQIWGYGQIPFEKMEEQPEDKALKIGGFVFPIQYRDTVYREVEIEQVKLTEVQAVERGLELARADVASKMGKNGMIESQKVLQKELKDGKLEVQVLNVVVEDIGQPQGFAPAPPADPNKNAKTQ
jgi:similar to stage IV sporulation protein